MTMVLGLERSTPLCYWVGEINTFVVLHGRDQHRFSAWLERLVPLGVGEKSE